MDYNYTLDQLAQVYQWMGKHRPITHICQTEDKFYYEVSCGIDRTRREIGYISTELRNIATHKNLNEKNCLAELSKVVSK